MLWTVFELPTGINVKVPHPARVYDYWLGGKDNFEADRRAGDAGYAVFPGVLQSVRANRAFLARLVRYLVTEAGVRQFLDIGSGLPTARNTHEIAQLKAPETRVVYVDHDPVVLMHARVLLDSTPEGRTEFLQADARDPGVILARAAATLDLGKPVAVLLLGVLHFLLDDAEVAAILATLTAALAPGSYLAVSHLASDIEPELMTEFIKRMGEAGAVDAAPRSNERVSSFFDGMDLLPPGVVPVTKWRPDTEREAAAATMLWGAVARKP